MTTRPAFVHQLFRLARLAVITLVIALLMIFLYGASLFPTYVTERPELSLSPDWTATTARSALSDLGLSVRAYV